jgi:hypothetical protein
MRRFFFLFFYILISSSCTDLQLVIPEDDPLEVALPLIDSKITLKKISGLLDNTNASIRFDASGRATAYYSGEVIKQDANAIFPAYPGTLPFIIKDSLSVISLPLNNTYLIKNAIFKDTKIKFGFEHSTNQPIHIVMEIMEVSKNGKRFKEEFDIPASPTGVASFISDAIDLDDWTYLSGSNSMTFRYTATLPDGSMIKLDKAAMLYDFIKFKYIDGYLGYHIFGIDGSYIDISLFDRWLSGGFRFHDPRISLQVVNGFGLPVRSKINTLKLLTTSGNPLTLESPYITNGIDFEYPKFNEIGQSKTTNFYFDKTNSNINELFKEKIAQIQYDIDAVVNPERDTSERGYITDNSFFVINVDVEVPLEGSVDSFTVSDTFNVNIPVPEDVVKARIKIETINDFPAEVIFSGIMLDRDNKVLGNLFNKPLKLIPATLGSDDKSFTPGTNILEDEFDLEKLNILAKTQKIKFIGQMSTIDGQSQRPLWLYDDYGLALKVGAIFDINK